SIQPEVPAKLEKICMKCLAKQPADRYPDAKALGRELRRLHSKLKQQSAQATLPRPRSVRTMRSSQPSVVLEAIETGKKIRIPHAVAVVGRSSECDIVLRASDVSKQHCRITVTEHQMLVEDLGSANGVFVNGERMERAVLKDKDRLGIANYEFI